MSCNDGVHQTKWVDTVTEANNKTRWRHSAELKQLIQAECAQPGASVASVALSHGISANVMHKWHRLAHEGAATITLSRSRFDALVLGLLSAKSLG